jgi:starvation-inducible DNA-binding protein
MSTKTPTKTENGQSKVENGQAAVNEQLAQAVSDLTDLRLQVKQAHWNVTGSSFIGLHKLLDKLAEELDEAIDTAAERQRALGFLTHGTARHVAKTAKLAQLSAERHSIEDVITHLTGLYGDASQAAQGAAKICDEHEDVGTSDLFADTIRMLDLHRYFLRSHLESDSSQ